MNCEDCFFPPPNMYIFISFSCLTAVARISNVIMKENDEREHLCLVPELRGK